MVLNRDMLVVFICLVIWADIFIGLQAFWQLQGKLTQQSLSDVNGLVGNKGSKVMTQPFSPHVALNVSLVNTIFDMRNMHACNGIVRACMRVLNLPI